MKTLLSYQDFAKVNNYVHINKNNISKKIPNLVKFWRYNNSLTPQCISFWFVWFAASWLLPIRVTASGSSEIKLGCPEVTILQKIKYEV